MEPEAIQHQLDYVLYILCLSLRKNSKYLGYPICLDAGQFRRIKSRETSKHKELQQSSYQPLHLHNYQPLHLQP